MNNLYYILDENKKPVPCDMIEMEGFFKNPDRIVKQETTNSGYWISTVFLGINHNHTGEGPPVLFETLVVGPDTIQDTMERYSTFEEAEKGHKYFVDKFSNLNQFVCFLKLIKGIFIRIRYAWVQMIWKVKHYKQFCKKRGVKVKTNKSKAISIIHKLFPALHPREEKIDREFREEFKNLIPKNCPTQKRLIEPKLEDDGRYMITLNHYYCPASALGIIGILEKVSGVEWHTSGCFMDVCAYYTKEKVEPFEIDFPWIEPKGAEGS